MHEKGFFSVVRQQKRSCQMISIDEILTECFLLKPNPFQVYAVMDFEDFDRMFSAYQKKEVVSRKNCKAVRLRFESCCSLVLLVAQHFEYCDNASIRVQTTRNRIRFVLNYYQLIQILR